jgi:hypothetical protein
VANALLIETYKGESHTQLRISDIDVFNLCSEASTVMARKSRLGKSVLPGDLSEQDLRRNVRHLDDSHFARSMVLDWFSI